jgi:hypothetical protein
MSQHVHDALQLAAVMMIYALGIALLMRGVHVYRGRALVPSAMVVILIGAYLVLKAMKHTWWTAVMLKLEHERGGAIASDLALPIVLDCLLLIAGSAVLFLASRPILGRAAGPAIVIGVATTLAFGAYLTS